MDYRERFAVKSRDKVQSGRIDSNGKGGHDDTEAIDWRHGHRSLSSRCAERARLDTAAHRRSELGGRKAKGRSERIPRVLRDRRPGVSQWEP
jgi:hypothetical protein